jgi:hypothetical protein
VCGRQLLAVPPARPGLPQPGRADRLARRLRALVPAAAAVGVACLVLVVVASAFAAGRLTRTTPSAPGAAPTTTAPGFLDEGPETGHRLGWETRDSELTVELRTIAAGTGFGRLELHVDGVRRGRGISALEGLRIRDADGRDLLLGGTVARIATAGSRPAPGGGTDTEVVLDHPVDPRAVATVELRGLVLAREVSERIGGTLVDEELRDRAPETPTTPTGWPPAAAARAASSGWPARTAPCPGRVGLPSRPVMIAVQALAGPQTALNPSRRRLLVTDDGGRQSCRPDRRVRRVGGHHGPGRHAGRRPLRRPPTTSRWPSRSHPGPGRGSRPRHLTITSAVR